MELCGDILSTAAQDQVVLDGEAGSGSIGNCLHDFLDTAALLEQTQILRAVAVGRAHLGASGISS